MKYITQFKMERTEIINRLKIIPENNRKNGLIKWQFDMALKGIEYHWDDDPYDVVGIDGKRTFTDAEAQALVEGMKIVNPLIWDDAVYVSMDDVENFYSTKKTMTVGEATKFNYMADTKELYADDGIILKDSDTVHVYMDNFFIIEHEDGRISTELFDGIFTTLVPANTDTLEGHIFTHCFNEGMMASFLSDQ